jgi:hypothetical protein
MRVIDGQFSQLRDAFPFAVHKLSLYGMVSLQCNSVISVEQLGSAGCCGMDSV